MQLERIILSFMLLCSRGRVVKASDLKSDGVSPRRFESCRLRTIFLMFFCTHNWKIKCMLWQWWDSNPRPFRLVPKTSALDHSATLPYNVIAWKFQINYLSLFSSVAEHWSRKPGVVSSNLTGGKPLKILWGPISLWFQYKITTNMTQSGWPSGLRREI